MFGIAYITVFGKSVRLWLLINIISYVVFEAYVFISVIKLQKKKLLSPCTENIFNKHTHSDKLKNICLIVEAAALALAGAFLGYEMNVLFGKCFGPPANNFFGNVLLAPLMMILLCYIFGIEAMKFTDKIMPAYALQYCLSNIANYFDGCCAGKYWKNGIYNLSEGEKQYPAPLYALAFSLIILFVLIAVKKKSKKVGMCYPLYVLLYSSTRLVTQFFREDNFSTVFSMPLYNFQCIVCTVIGIALCIIAFLYGSRIEKFLLRNSIGYFYIKKQRK